MAARRIDVCLPGRAHSLLPRRRKLYFYCGLLLEAGHGASPGDRARPVISRRRRDVRAGSCGGGFERPAPPIRSIVAACVRRCCCSPGPIARSRGRSGRHRLGLFQGQRLTGEIAMAKAGIPRLRPEPKEGLAITNGAQLSTSIAALAAEDAATIVLAAEIAAAMAFEAMRAVTWLSIPTFSGSAYLGAIAARRKPADAVVGVVPGRFPARKGAGRLLAALLAPGPRRLP